MEVSAKSFKSFIWRILIKTVGQLELSIRKSFTGISTKESVDLCSPRLKPTRFLFIRASKARIPPLLVR